MWRAKLHLSAIVEAADAIAKFLAGVDRESFVQDDLLCSAVLHNLGIIGQAAARIADELRKCHPEVKWSRMASFRSLALHSHGDPQWANVWAAATEDAPDLRNAASQILSKEFADAQRPEPGRAVNATLFHERPDFPTEAVGALCQRYQVRELAVFGSAVHGHLREDSDVDFLVAFSPKAEIGITELGGMQRELSVLIGREVDLVPKDGLKPLIRDEVLSSAEVVYAASKPVPDRYG